MTVFVLAGGLGTRIAGLWPDRPKALVPVAGRPFVDLQLGWLATHGLTDVVLCAGHGADALAAHVGDGAAHGVRVRVVVEDAPRGTAGAIAHALAATAHADGTFLAMNGDTWAEFSPADLLSLHADHAAIATIACYPVEEAAERGTVEFDAEGRLRAFREKAAAGPGWVSGGVYALEPRAFADVPADRATSLERDLFPRLLDRGEAIAAWRGGGGFWDMGTPEGLARAERALAGRGTP